MSKRENMGQNTIFGNDDTHTQCVVQAYSWKLDHQKYYVDSTANN